MMKAIKEILKKKIGLNPDSLSTDSWNKILRIRMEASGITDVSCYLRYLQKSSEELDELIELVVVPETFFFRDQSSMEFLAQIIKNKIAKSQSHQVYKILSLPCSTGEEPYSIAMTLIEKNIPSYSYQIHAMDVSKEALFRACRGIYTKNSFRGEYAYYQNKYFTLTSEGFQINENVKKAVNFSYGNIVYSNQFFSDSDPIDYDIILCRNLFIYLDSQAQKIAFANFKRMLKPDGLLFVAPAEIELVRKYGYEFYGDPRCCAFQRSEHLSKLPLGAISIKRKPVPALHKKTVHEMTSMFPKPYIDYKNVKNHAADHILITAREYADSGKFLEAEELCRDCINKKQADEDIYFLLALIYHAQRDEAKAEEFFLKTIYLKPDHYEALVYLALLSEKQALVDKAVLYRKRAAKAYQENK